MSANPAVLQFNGITKRFGKVVANEDVSFELHPGEVIGLLGENGAGKTTLMNVAFGLYRQDAGEILVDGEVCQFSSTAHAISQGIGMVTQHSNVVERHTVLENIMVGLPGRGGRLDHAGTIMLLESLREDYGLWLAPDRLVSSLAVGERQRLDIIRTLVRRARVLILDEPTSVLTPQETEGLFAAISALQSDGVGVIFITHKLAEVRRIAGRVVVLRHGKVTANIENDGALTNEELARLMCGHEPEQVTRHAHKLGAPRLVMKAVQLQSPGGKLQIPAPVNLTIHSGEVVGIAGVSGNGQVELAETLAGMVVAKSGTVKIDDRDVYGSTPKEMQAAGLAYVPEDRIGVGLAGSMSLRENLVLTYADHPRFSNWGWFKLREVERFGNELIKAYDVRPANLDTPVGLFSGGNQQKIIVARELAFGPKVLVIAQPTRGLDVASTNFVHREIMQLRSQGCAVLLISDDLDEVMQLSDRVAVMYENTIVCDLSREKASVEKIGLAMTGAVENGDGIAA